jgi:hypothetical protein
MVKNPLQGFNNYLQLQDIKLYILFTLLKFFLKSKTLNLLVGSQNNLNL